jgi:hypothetical protein
MTIALSAPPRATVALLAAAATALLATGAAHALEGGKAYARVDTWEIRKHGSYCTAKIAYDGDRALRIASSADRSSFGFMGMGTGSWAPGAKVPIVYWFDGDKKNRFNATATARQNEAEDGGAPWLVVIEPTREFSPVGFMVGRSVTFSYRLDGKTQEETYTFRRGNDAFEKLVACSGV